jgi:exopolysaccharide biosynthesis polyprenyl glycosylphosphotransferase
MNEQAALASFSSAARALGVRNTNKALLRAKLAVVLIPIDFCAISLGFCASSFVRFGTFWSPTTPILVLSTILLYVICGTAFKAYTGQVLISHVATATRAGLSSVISAAILSTLLFMLKAGAAFSRQEVALGFLFASAAIVLFRIVYVHWSRTHLGGSLYSCLVLCDGVDGNPQRDINAIEVGRYFNIECPGPEDYDRLAQVVDGYDRVIVECPFERRGSWSHVLKGMNVHAEVVAPELADLRPVGIGSLAHERTLVIARGPLALRQRFAKRLLDLSFCGVAIIFFLPVMLATALAIKLDSKGPIFFMQPRIGRQNRIFFVFKFRSMYVKLLDHSGTTSTQRGDQRITRVGRFIRATSVDELPQLFNVIRGDMSVVGPRPHAIHSTAEDQLFWDIDTRYWQRHACKPGITGLAQIKGFRGATHQKSDLTDRVTADLEYLASWSLWNDILIIARTVAVLVHKNAY